MHFSADWVTEKRRFVDSAIVVVLHGMPLTGKTIELRPVIWQFVHTF